MIARLSPLRPLLLVVLAAPLLVTPRAFAVPADTALAERSALVAADRRCALFGDRLSAALVAAALQARGALLRAGRAEHEVDAIAARGRTIGERAVCSDPSIQEAARRAQSGFDGLARMQAMTFPGTVRAWEARRMAYADGWRVVQDISGSVGTARFGLREAPGSGGVRQLVLVIDDPRGLAPASVRLQMRDTDRHPRAVMRGVWRPVVATAPAGGANTDLEARLAVASATRTWFAAARTLEPAFTDRARRPHPARLVFAFPADAAGALARLDPREAVEIVLDPAPGGRGGRLLVEVGDFAPAAALFGR
jgi:hypothetical protein